MATSGDDLEVPLTVKSARRPRRAKAIVSDSEDDTQHSVPDNIPTADQCTPQKHAQYHLHQDIMQHDNRKPAQEGVPHTPSHVVGIPHASSSSSPESEHAPLTFSRTVVRGRRKVLADESDVSEASTSSPSTQPSQARRRRAAAKPGRSKTNGSAAWAADPSKDSMPPAINPRSLTAPRPHDDVIVISSSDDESVGHAIQASIPASPRAPTTSYRTSSNEPSGHAATAAHSTSTPARAQGSVKGALELAMLLNKQLRLDHDVPSALPPPPPSTNKQHQHQQLKTPKAARTPVPGTLPEAPYSCFQVPAPTRPASSPDVVDLTQLDCSPASASTSSSLPDDQSSASSDSADERGSVSQPAARAPGGSRASRGSMATPGQKQPRKRIPREDSPPAGPSAAPRSPHPPHTTHAITLPQHNTRHVQLVPARKRSTTGAKQQPFTKQREGLAQQLYAEWNGVVFRGQLPASLPIVWNPRLASTAGQVLDDGSLNSIKQQPSDHMPTRLELSSKIIDSEERLRQTLSHEMCHVAAWALDREYHMQHGPAFWRWARRFKELVDDIEITRLHNFSTSAPYRWQCTNPSCSKVYSRHRNTIDPNRHLCGQCHHKLSFLGKFDRSGAPRAAAGAGGGSTNNPYAMFVKENFADAKRSLPPGTPHATVMKEVSSRWSVAKQQRQVQGQVTPAPVDSVQAAGTSLPPRLEGDMQPTAQKEQQSRQAAPGPSIRRVLDLELAVHGAKGGQGQGLLQGQGQVQTESRAGRQEETEQQGRSVWDLALSDGVSSPPGRPAAHSSELFHEPWQDQDHVHVHGPDDLLVFGAAGGSIRVGGLGGAVEQGVVLEAASPRQLAVARQRSAGHESPDSAVFHAAAEDAAWLQEGGGEQAKESVGMTVLPWKEDDVHDAHHTAAAAASGKVEGMGEEGASGAPVWSVESLSNMLGGTHL